MPQRKILCFTKMRLLPEKNSRVCTVGVPVRLTGRLVLGYLAGMRYVHRAKKTNTDSVA